MSTVVKPPVPAEVVYPERDGKPMGETPLHRKTMNTLIETLDILYDNDPMVYVSGNMFLYYQEGNPKRAIVPDVMLVRGVPKRPERRVYKTWQEGGKGPDFVVEVTSRSTQAEDIGNKFDIYRDDLKVREYFLFDPEADYIDPPLTGYRLVDHEYEVIRPVSGRLPSEVLGLHLEADGWDVRLVEPVSGVRILTPRERGDMAEEARAIARTERIRAEYEATARKEAEAEVERLRRLLEKLGGTDAIEK